MSLSKNCPPVLISLALLILVAAIKVNPVFAAEFVCPLTVKTDTKYSPSSLELTFEVNGQAVLDKLKSVSSSGNFIYRFERKPYGIVCNATGFRPSPTDTSVAAVVQKSFWSPQCNYIYDPGSHIVEWIYKVANSETVFCNGTYEIEQQTSQCTLDVSATGNKDPDDDTWQLNVSDITLPKTYNHDNYYVQIVIDSNKMFSTSKYKTEILNDFTVKIPPDYRTAGIKHHLSMSISPLYLSGDDSNRHDDFICGSTEYNIVGIGEPTLTPTSVPTSVPTLTPECIDSHGDPLCQENTCQNQPLCVKADPAQPQINPKKICEQLGKEGDKNYDNCNACFLGEGKYVDNGPGSWTALGCIPTDTAGFVKWLLGPFMGIAGGIAFLLILKGGYQIMFSQGNPESITDGRDTIVAAVSGLVVIILSVAILEIIGVDILDLPGFGR